MWCNSYRMTAKYICVYLIDATCVQNYGKIGLMDFIKRFNPATIIRKKKKLLHAYYPNIVEAISHSLTKLLYYYYIVHWWYLSHSYERGTRVLTDPPV